MNSMNVTIWNMNTRQWKVLPQISDSLKNQFPEMKPLVLQLLSNRGISTQEEIDEFLYPDYGRDIHDPFLFLDMEKACLRIFDAIVKKEKILVYGDYDADGVCSTALMVQALEGLGAQTDVYIPFREREGYGINMGAVGEILKKGVRLVVTVDCGISNREEISALQKNGVDVIVTDHHAPPKKLPEPYAIINPKRHGEKYPTHEICGTAVAYKVAQALFSEKMRKLYGKILSFPVSGFEKWLLDLVAVGTVTDVIQLRKESRAFLKYGLLVLRKTRRMGLLALCKVASMHLEALDASAIGFQIGPRLNAAGRLDHASVSYELLIAKNEHDAEKFAQELNKKNQERQKISEKMFQEALARIEPKKDNVILFVKDDSWHPSLVGLVAGKIMDIYSRPALVMGKNPEGKIVGSGRSIEGFDITKALEQCGEFLLKFGGHAQACGFTVKDEKSLPLFEKRLMEIASKGLEGKKFAKDILIDSTAELSEMNWETMESLELFKPYGQGNSQPKFLVKSCKLVAANTVGQNGNHIKGALGDGRGTVRNFIGFSMKEKIEGISPGELLDVVCEPAINEWNGNREIQLKLIDLRRTLSE